MGLARRAEIACHWSDSNLAWRAIASYEVCTRPQSLQTSCKTAWGNQKFWDSFVGGRRPGHIHDVYRKQDYQLDREVLCPAPQLRLAHARCSSERSGGVGFTNLRTISALMVCQLVDGNGGLRCQFALQRRISHDYVRIRTQLNGGKLCWEKQYRSRKHLTARLG